VAAGSDAGVCRTIVGIASLAGAVVARSGFCVGVGVAGSTACRIPEHPANKAASIAAATAAFHLLFTLNFPPWSYPLLSSLRLLFRRDAANPCRIFRPYVTFITQDSGEKLRFIGFFARSFIKSE
jgi:hypothetical protein